MIKLNSNLQGKQTYFGHMENYAKTIGFTLGGAWEYDKGYYDAALHRDGGETIYIRLPFKVIDGMLDDRNAIIEFEQPYVIKHLVHIGLDHDGDSLLSATGFAQFQAPIDQDAPIEDKSRWEIAGEEAIQTVLSTVPLQ